MDLDALDARLGELLPPRYQHCYSAVSPRSMGSAKVLYGADGKVAWDQIWTTFCDLALAGGPPHRGTLLEPASVAEVASEPARYARVVAEIDRAIGLTSDAVVVPGSAPGWVGVRCHSATEAAWLQFAILAENVAARRRGSVLQLPAGPAFRPEKEIKNVVVALAKTLHYWDGHLSDDQQGLAGSDEWDVATPADDAADRSALEAARGEIEAEVRAVGLRPMRPGRYAGWVGVEAADEDEAVWFLRAVVVEQVPARREESVVYLPVDQTPGTGRSARVVRAFRQAWDLRRQFLARV